MKAKPSNLGSAVPLPPAPIYRKLLPEHEPPSPPARVSVVEDGDEGVGRGGSGAVEAGAFGC